MIIVKPVSMKSNKEMSRRQLIARATLLDERLRAIHDGRFGPDLQNPKQIDSICQSRDEVLEELNSRPSKKPLTPNGGRLLSPAEELERDFRATLSDIGRNSGMFRGFAARAFSRFITPAHCPSPLDEELVFLRTYSLDPNAASPDASRPEPEQDVINNAAGIYLTYTRWEQTGLSELEGFIVAPVTDSQGSSSAAFFVVLNFDYELPARPFDVVYEVSKNLEIRGGFSAISNNVHGWQWWGALAGGRFILGDERGGFSGDDSDLPDEGWPLFEAVSGTTEARRFTVSANTPFSFTTPVISPSEGRKVITIQYVCLFDAVGCQLNVDMRFLTAVNSFFSRDGDLRCVIRRV